jgi:hypothetical protein
MTTDYFAIACRIAREHGGHTLADIRDLAVDLKREAAEAEAAAALEGDIDDRDYFDSAHRRESEDGYHGVASLFDRRY